MSHFIIAGPWSESEGPIHHRLYWSNENGWVNKADATIFNGHERWAIDFPMGWTGIMYVSVVTPNEE